MSILAIAFLLMVVAITIFLQQRLNNSVLDCLEGLQAQIISLDNLRKMQDGEITRLKDLCSKN